MTFVDTKEINAHWNTWQNLVWYQGLRYLPCGQLDLLKPCIAESLVGSSSVQVFPKLSSWSALRFQDATHTPLRYRSASCWCSPGCPHPHARRMPRLEGRDEQQPLQRDSGPHGCCFPWGQWVTDIRDGSPSSSPGSCSSCAPSRAALHLWGSPGLQHLPPCTQKPRWVVCQRFSETFLRYLPIAGELLP